MLPAQAFQNALSDISIQLTAIGVAGTATLVQARAAPEFNPTNALLALISEGYANKPLTARIKHLSTTVVWTGQAYYAG